MMDRSKRVWSWLGPVAIMATLSGATLPRAATAEKPYVHFDAAFLTACRDVTPDDFREANPDERLVEAQIQVSSLIHHGSEEDLIEYFYRIESAEHRCQIVDYLPKTTLASELSGNVGIEEKRERTRSLGLNVAGSFEYLISASGTGSIGSKNTSSVRYELLPPLELVAASGTLRRGTAVYFKLKPSGQTSLEGGKQFVVVLRVPYDWRGDYLHVSCTALGYRRGVLRPLDEPAPSGAGRFLIALYLEGDEQAKAVAAQFVRAEGELRHIAAQQRAAIQRQSYPTVAHKVGALLAVVEPKIPSSWLDQLFFAPAHGSHAHVQQWLPDPVRQAAEQFAEAKRKLHQLSGAKSEKPGAAR